MKQNSKLYYLLICLVCTSLVLIGAEAWDYWSEDYERTCVKKDLPKLPFNWNIRNITKIQEHLKDQESFRFVVFGDVHQNYRRFERMISAAKEYAPDFVVITGDVTNEGLFLEYRRLLSALEECPLPVLVCAGNHDLRNYGSRCFSHVFGPLNFYFDINDTRFVFLNNVSRDVNRDLAQLPSDQHNGRLGRGLDGPMLTELQGQLRERERNFIIMHMPPPVAPFDFYCFRRNGDAFVDLLTAEAERVAAVLFGHIHGYGETLHEGVRYIEAGGAGAIRDINRDRAGIDTRTNFVLVDVTPEEEYYRTVFLQ